MYFKAASPIAMAVQHVKSTAQFHIGVTNSILDTSQSCVRIIVANPMAVPSELPKGLRLATLHSCTTASVVSVGTIQVSDRKASLDFDDVPADVSLPSASHVPDDASFILDEQVTQPSTEPDFSAIIDSRLSAEERDSLRETLHSHADIFASDPTAPTPMRHIPPVHIDTGSARPIRCPAFRRHPLAHRHIEDQVNHMLDKGLIEESSSTGHFLLCLPLNQTEKFGSASTIDALTPQRCNSRTSFRVWMIYLTLCTA